jgi:hypothetical protein
MDFLGVRTKTLDYAVINSYWENAIENFKSALKTTILKIAFNV